VNIFSRSSMRQASDTYPFHHLYTDQINQNGHCQQIAILPQCTIWSYVFFSLPPLSSVFFLTFIFWRSFQGNNAILLKDLTPSIPRLLLQYPNEHPQPHFLTPNLPHQERLFLMNFSIALMELHHYCCQKEMLNNKTAKFFGAPPLTKNLSFYYV